MSGMVVLAISAFGLRASVLAESRPEQQKDTALLEAGSGQGSQPDGMVFVKGGCFEMGDDFAGEPIDEPYTSIKKPVHTVCVGGFYIGRYEVTQRQWTEVMGNNPSYFKPCDDCPVESVSWDAVQEFLDKLSRKEGKNYRLPTEAEWEYAARSRGKSDSYAGTDNDDELVDYAWYGANADGKAHPVGRKKPNGLGLYDMSGNVWEWVEDWYGKDYYKISPRDNPKGPESGEYRVFRGGAWVCAGKGSERVSARSYGLPDDLDSMRGFRVVMDK